MTKKKVLDRVFFLLGAVSSLAAIGMALYAGTDWVWPMNTLLWVGVAFIQQLRIEQAEKKFI